MPAVTIRDDAARVAALRRLGILDQPPAPDLDAITRLAAFVTGAPVGIINLLDAERQWQASVHAGAGAGAAGPGPPGGVPLRAPSPECPADGCARGGGPLRHSRLPDRPAQPAAA